MGSEEHPANFADGDQSWPPHSVAGQLEKILASPSFSNSARLSRFLRYTVEQAMNGRSHLLKEYMLGLDVFDRPATFDPRTDAVVRVEAGRLRAKLREYYSSLGERDPLIINLPRGTYAPTFTVCGTGASEEAAKEKSRGRLRWWTAAGVLAVLALVSMNRRAPDPPLPLSNVAVLPFEDLSATQTNQAFVDGLMEELTSLLTNVRGLNVAAHHSTFRFRGKTQDLAEVGRALKVGSVLEGRIRNTGSRVRLTVELIGVRDGYHLWSQVYERDLEDPARVFDIQNEIAHAVTRALTPRLMAGWPTTRP